MPMPMPMLQQSNRPMGSVVPKELEISSTLDSRHDDGFEKLHQDQLLGEDESSKHYYLRLIQKLEEEASLLRTMLGIPMAISPIQGPPETSIPNPTAIPGTPNQGDTSLPKDSDHLVMNQGEARSLFFKVTYREGRYTSALFEVKLKHKGGGGGLCEPQPLLQPVAKFFEGLRAPFIVTETISSGSKLCLLVDRSLCLRSPNPFLLKALLNNPKLRPYAEQGYVFDLNTRTLGPLKPPQAPKPLGAIVSAFEGLYYLASPKFFPHIPDPSFEKYHPGKDVWERQPHCPYYSEDWSCMEIVGDAVCKGCILFTFLSINYARDDDRKDNGDIFQVVAFDTSRNEWSRVKVENFSPRCVPFTGRAVAVDDQTLYALSSPLEHDHLVIAFSFRKDTGDDGEIAYSLSCLFKLPGLKIEPPPFPFSGFRSQYLVHLGKHDFCHVMTGENHTSDRVQHVCITTFEVVNGAGGSRNVINTLNSTVYTVDNRGFDCFSVDFSFMLETTMKQQPKQDKKTEGGVAKAKAKQAKPHHAKAMLEIAN